VSSFYLICALSIAEPFKRFFNPIIRRPVFDLNILTKDTQYAKDSGIFDGIHVCLFFIHVCFSFMFVF